MNQTICNAIAALAVIEFNYRGLIRVAEPFCHGISRAGNEVLRAFQIGRDSDSGTPFGWKLYDVSQMSAVRTTGATFRPVRPGYNPNDSQMASVHCSA